MGVVSGFILIQRVWGPSVGNKEAAGWNRKTKTYSLSKLPKPIQTRAKKVATSEGHSGQPPATDLGVRPAGSRLHSAYVLPARPSRARRESAVKRISCEEQSASSASHLPESGALDHPCHDRTGTAVALAPELGVIMLYNCLCLCPPLRPICIREHTVTQTRLPRVVHQPKGCGV